MRQRIADIKTDMHMQVTHFYQQKGNPYEKIDQLDKAERAMYANLNSMLAANARFGKVKSSATGAATLKVRMGDITLRVDAVPRVFEADVTTLASGVFTVTLPDACAKFKSLAFTPLGTSPCTWTFDNLVTGATPAFDLYAFNLAGTQIARAGKLRAETV